MPLLSLRCTTQSSSFHTRRVPALKKSLASFLRNTLLNPASQWLGFQEPDPEKVHYFAILEAVSKLCEEHGVPQDECYLWLDYVAIPQINATAQLDAINSIAWHKLKSMAFLRFFVVVAPKEGVHNLKGRADGGMV